MLVNVNMMFIKLSSISICIEWMFIHRVHIDQRWVNIIYQLQAFTKYLPHLEDALNSTLGGAPSTSRGERELRLPLKAYEQKGG